MQDKPYSVRWKDSVYISGLNFMNTGRFEHASIIQCLEAVSKDSISMNTWISPWTTKKVNGIEETQYDYSGRPGYLSIDQHNPAVMTVRGYWGEPAKSDSHLAPSVSLDITFSAPTGLPIDNTDMYQVLNWLTERKYNVCYDRKPRERCWTRRGRVESNRDCVVPDCIFPTPFKPVWKQELK